MNSLQNVQYVSEKCGFCHQEIPTVLLESPLSSILTLHEVTGPNDPIRDEESEFRNACYHCTEELYELMEDFTPKEGIIRPGYGEVNFRDYDSCSFCGGEVDTQLGFVALQPPLSRAEQGYILCRDCYGVFESFLAGIPESQPGSNISTGPPEIGWMGHQFVLELIRARSIQSAKHSLEKFHHYVTIDGIGPELLKENVREMKSDYPGPGSPRKQSRPLYVKLGLNPNGAFVFHRELQQTPHDPPVFGAEHITGTIVFEVPVSFPERILHGRIANRSAEQFRKAIVGDIDHAVSTVRSLHETSEQRIAALRGDLKQREPEAWDLINEIGYEAIINPEEG